MKIAIGIMIIGGTGDKFQTFSIYENSWILIQPKKIQSLEQDKWNIPSTVFLKQNHGKIFPRNKKKEYFAS